jgi:hypothetical protein
MSLSSALVADEQHRKNALASAGKIRRLLMAPAITYRFLDATTPALPVLTNATVKTPCHHCPSKPSVPHSPDQQAGIFAIRHG